MVTSSNIFTELRDVFEIIETLTKEIYLYPTDDTIIFESSVYSLFKPVADEVTMLESSVFNMNKAVTDEAAILESSTFNMGQAVIDEATMLESIAGTIAAGPYDSESYFSETYVDNPAAAIPF